MRGFLRLTRRRTDTTPLDAYGKPVRLVAAEADRKGPPRIVRGGPTLVRLSAVSSVQADKARDDGKPTSLIMRNDGQGPIEVYESPMEVYAIGADVDAAS